MWIYVRPCTASTGDKHEGSVRWVDRPDELERLKRLFGPENVLEPSHFGDRLFIPDSPDERADSRSVENE